MSFTDEQSEMLRAPLSRDHVKTRRQASTQLSYIEGWHAIAEANRIFGFDGWRRETIRLEQTNAGTFTITPRDKPAYEQFRVGFLAVVRVTVGDVVREGTGFGSGMARPEATGDAFEGAIKEAETDAMKRALMTFGNPFGLALYDKDQTNVADAKPAGPPAPHPAFANDDGTLSMTRLKAWGREFGREVKSTGDADEFIALLGVEENRIGQVALREHLPDWWFGNDDAGGLARLLTEHEAHLKEHEARKAA